MITRINEFRKITESLSSDRARAAKLQTLIQLGREMVEAYNKAEEAAAAKAASNQEVAELLARMNKTSVIAEGVLIEVFKPYESSRLATKEYFEFVENAVGVIGEDFRQLSNSVREVSTKLSGGTSYIRTNKNTRNIETGTLAAATPTPATTESIASIIGGWFQKIKDFVMGILPAIESRLASIDAESKKFNPDMLGAGRQLESIQDPREPEPTNSSNYVMEDTVDGFLKPYITDNADYRLDSDGITVMLYVPAADVLFDIKDQHAPEWNILQLGMQEFCANNGLYNAEVTTTSDGEELVLSAETDIVDVRNPQHEGVSPRNDEILLWNEYMKLVEIIDGILSEHGELSASYWKSNVTTDLDSLTGEPNVTFNYINQHKNEILKNFYELYDGLKGWMASGHDISRYGDMSKIDVAGVLGDKLAESTGPGNRNEYSKLYKRQRREQARNIAAVLEKAKSAIAAATEESYYNELAATKETMIKQLLTELGAKSVAIDDKILSLVKMEEKQAFDMKTYEEKMTNAEQVGDAVAKMTIALLAIHRKTVPMSGSVRQFKDDTESPDGTFGAHFDHETKRVVLPSNEGAGSWLGKVWSRVKTFFASFKTASKQLDAALAQI